MIWLVIWVVLMIIWLLGGGFVHSRGQNPDWGYWGVSNLIPWACVLILGLVIFGGLSGPGAVKF